MGLKDLIPSIVRPGAWRTWVEASSDSGDAADAHRAAAAPHTGHETPAGAQAKVDGHASAADPHSQYATAAEVDGLASEQYVDSVADEAGERDGVEVGRVTDTGTAVRVETPAVTQFVELDDGTPHALFAGDPMPSGAVPMKATYANIWNDAGELHWTDDGSLRLVLERLPTN